MSFVKMESDQSMSIQMEGDDGSSIQSPQQQTSKEHKHQSKTQKFMDKQPFQKLLDYLLKVCNYSFIFGYAM